MTFEHFKDALEGVRQGLGHRHLAMTLALDPGLFHRRGEGDERAEDVEVAISGVSSVPFPPTGQTYCTVS